MSSVPVFFPRTKVSFVDLVPCEIVARATRETNRFFSPRERRESEKEEEEKRQRNKTSFHPSAGVENHWRLVNLKRERERMIFKDWTVSKIFASVKNHRKSSPSTERLLGKANRRKRFVSLLSVNRGWIESVNIRMKLSMCDRARH